MFPLPAAWVCMEGVPEENGPLFVCFPYVGPEPVLVKCSLLYTNGSARPFLLTVQQTVMHLHDPAAASCHQVPLYVSRASLGK